MPGLLLAAMQFHTGPKSCPGPLRARQGQVLALGLFGSDCPRSLLSPNRRVLGPSNEDVCALRPPFRFASRRTSLVQGEKSYLPPIPGLREPAH